MELLASPGSKFSQMAILEDFVEMILRICSLNYAHAGHISIAPECCPSALLHENCGSRRASDYMCGHIALYHCSVLPLKINVYTCLGPLMFCIHLDRETCELHSQNLDC